MSKIEYIYSCSGCGSGNSCTYTILSNGIDITHGTVQIPESASCTEIEKRNQIVKMYPYAPSDTAFANGTQFYPAAVAPIDYTFALAIGGIAVVVVAAYLIGQNTK